LVQTADWSSAILTDIFVAFHNPSVNRKDNNRDPLLPRPFKISIHRLSHHSTSWGRATCNLVFKWMTFRNVTDGRVLRSHAGWWYAVESNPYQKNDKWHDLTSNSHRWSERHYACTTEQNSLRGANNSFTICYCCQLSWRMNFRLLMISSIWMCNVVQKFIAEQGWENWSASNEYHLNEQLQYTIVRKAYRAYVSKSARACCHGNRQRIAWALDFLPA
jgi:hypothetical protein